MWCSFPRWGGTIAIGYNKSDCKGLKLTQKQLVDVYMGTIKTWDQLKCGKGPIKVVHRSDGSGTTFAFTNSLSAFSSAWKSKVGEGKSVIARRAWVARVMKGWRASSPTRPGPWAMSTSPT